MQLVQAFVSNPIKVSVGALLLSLFGAISLVRMPMQLTPEVQIPTITVETRWPGASPQEIEREIIQEQEEQLKSVEGMTKMTSESTDSSGTITMEFVIGSDMEESLLKVNSRLQQVREYPLEADEPVISTSSSSDRPIAWFILSPRPPSADEVRAFAEAHPELRESLLNCINDQSPGLLVHRLRKLADEHPVVRAILPPAIEVPKLKRFAEDYIEASLERVSGVSNANVLGGREEELQVVIDPSKLAARQLTIDDVRRVLRTQNKDTSGGDFWEGKRRYVVRTLNQFRSPEQVENQLLAVRDDAPIYVRDVAEVRLGFKKPSGVVRRFGESNIAINAIRETGANVLDVMEGLRAARDRLNDDVLAKRGLVLTQVYDETEYIYSSVNLVNQNIIIGSALTMMVLMLFLHLGWRTLIFAPLIGVTAVAAAGLSPWIFALTLALIIGAGFWFARGALVVGVAIPVSIVGTFLCLNLLGRSLNVISLAGMAFAVGMLVDNAVVVLENIFQHYERGLKPMQAAVRGTKEVWGAVVASTLTTLAVFVPVLFVQDEAGQLFRDIALAISSAVALSLLVSVTLIPTFTARLLKPSAASARSRPPARGDRTAKARGRGGRMVRIIRATGGRFVESIVAVNGWIGRSLVRQLGVVLSLVLLAGGLSYLLWPKVEYLPSGNRNLVFGIILPPPGYNLDELMEMGEIAESTLLPYWDVDYETVDRGSLEYPLIKDFFYVARGRSVFMGVRAVDPTQSARLIPLIQSVGEKLPGSIVVAKQSSLFEQGLTAGRTIDVEITGPELPRLVALGGRVLGQTMEILPEAQARPVPSLDLSTPEVHVQPRLEQSEAVRIDATSLGYAVDALVDGAYASDYFIGGDKVDLTIKGEESAMQRSQDLEALTIATPGGQLVPLGALARVVKSSGPEQINHRERQRAITIEVSPPPEVPLEEALEMIEAQIVRPIRDADELAGGYRIELSGTVDKLQTTWDSLFWNVVLAILITYLLMAALFESWVYPLVIILSVPLGAVGGILGLRALGLYLGWVSGATQPLDVLTMLGFVILIGTVVNNAILIVHQALNGMREGEQPQSAVLASVRSRIRPIFMTTGTTVLGLMPLVLFPGSGSELYRGLGSVVLGGLLVSTVFTLVFVPTLFSLAMRLLGDWHQPRQSADPFEREEEDESPAAEREPEVAAV
jgi:HAE1 family hydrophobic/amphiphilic exporter-1